MTCCSRRSLALVAVFITAMAAVLTVNGQAPTAPTAPQKAPAGSGPPQVMAEDVYKNIQVLKGITASELWDTMGFISASTGLNCADCHVDESLIDIAKFAQDTPRKN